MKLFRAGSLRRAEMRRLGRQLALSRAALWAERLARAFWPLFVILCLGAALALFGAFEAAGPMMHRALLAVFGLAIAAALVFGGMRFRTPDGTEARARLDSSDPRRPLATLADDLAVGRGQDETESVWRAHRIRAAIAASRLTAAWPDLRLAAHDRWALRLVAPTLLVAGLIGTGGDWGARIATIATPPPAGPQTAPVPDAVAVAEAWATPPAYTGLATVYLTHDGDGGPGAEAPPIRLPQGSEITIRVTDASGLPKLEGGAIAGMDRFATLGGGLAETRGALADSGELAVTGPDGELGRWRIEMIPDAPPTVALDGAPHATVTRALAFDFAAGDDYGVTAAWAEIAPENHDPEAARGMALPPIEFGLPLPLTGDARDVTGHVIRDLTAHPWAGAEVVMRLHAEDGAGQVTTSAPIALTIPARQFTNPLAAALAEQRLALVLDHAAAPRVLDVTQAVTRRPAEIIEDAGTYLTIRTAIRRLARAVGTATVPEATPGVAELFWLAALALEDGDLSSALERLRAAEERLREALESGTDAEVASAMEELRAALDQYLREFAERQMAEPANPNAAPADPNRMLSRQDLEEMLDRMERQAESGMRDEARQMLSELQRMLENMQAAQGNGQPGAGQPTMQALQEMIMRQRELSDRTFDQLREERRGQSGEGMPGQQGGQPGQQPGQQPGRGDGLGQQNGEGQAGQGRRGEGPGTGAGRGGTGPGGLSTEQEALRRQLDELARGLGGDGEAARRALDEAAREMGEARDNLSEGSTSDAVRDQMEALDRLNDGARALAQQMQEGQGQAGAEGERQGPGQGRDRASSDPFGRPMPGYGPYDGRATDVPDQELVDRARELMQLLRDRAAERTRPELELDYFERLLDEF